MDGEPVIPIVPAIGPSDPNSLDILQDGQPAARIASRAGEPSTPIWREVMRLAWPVLARQFLILLVGLSDRYLAGHFHPPDESLQVSYQAAQTTANYLSWFIVSYTVLVSVGSTALVARFVGAGDHKAAIHVTNQSMILAVLLGLLGTIAGLWKL